jgi:hypothetical protein
MRTSFHHQPEAQHPKFFSYPQAAGRLPIYRKRAERNVRAKAVGHLFALRPSRTTSAIEFPI